MLNSCIMPTCEPQVQSNDLLSQICCYFSTRISQFKGDQKIHFNSTVCLCKLYLYVCIYSIYVSTDRTNTFIDIL